MGEGLVIHERIEPRWSGECVVAAPGPSLTPDVAAAIRGHRIIAVTRAWRTGLESADVLYAADQPWWRAERGAPGFQGERWSCHNPNQPAQDKREVAETYGINLVHGRNGNTFSTDPSVIHHGGNSLFQGINLAILFGAETIILVGADMNGRYQRYIPAFEMAARQLPEGVRVLNATPGSHLKCFPEVAGYGAG